jgi:NADH-quinone oxidoreductase subunit L
MTAYYIFRLLILTFLGGPRMSKEVAHHAHESPLVMTLPLVLLAVLTAVAGWIEIPKEDGRRFTSFLAVVLPASDAHHGGVAAFVVVLVSVAVAVAGIALAFFRYYSVRAVRPGLIGQPRSALHRLLLNAYYVDWIYDRVIVQPLFALWRVCAGLIDQQAIDGAVNLLGRAVIAWAAGFRRLQTGYVMNYALTMLAGAVVVVAFLLAR